MQCRSVLLPAPEGPTMAEHLALVDGEVDAAQHVELAPHVHEALVQIFDDDERRSGIGTLLPAQAVDRARARDAA